MADPFEEITTALPRDLDGLPRRDGFRMRGMEMTRLESFVDAAFAFAVSYAMGFAALSLELLLLNWHAWRRRAPLRLNEREAALARGELLGWSIPFVVGLVSLLIALTVPPAMIGWSGWIYFSMAVLFPLQRWLRRRAWDKVSAATR